MKVIFVLFIIMYFFSWDTNPSPCALKMCTLIYVTGNCSTGWERYLGSCFHVNTTDIRDWASSRAVCRALGGDLAIFENGREQSFVISKCIISHGFTIKIFLKRPSKVLKIMSELKMTMESIFFEMCIHFACIAYRRHSILCGSITY